MTVRQWLWSRRYQAVYLALISWFAWRVGSFYSPTTGFSSLVLFGDRFAPQRLPQLHDVKLCTLEDSDGYDGQFYAQLAVAGQPFDPGLAAALDSPAYRTHRLLIPELAHVVGLGRPAWVVNVYALSNLFCWLVLAWVLWLWWFPPTCWHNLLRWAGVLFGSGMVLSVTRSLSDGPALLGVALGARCAETNRRWLAGLAFAATGFVRETSVLAAVALLPDRWRDRKGWRLGALAVVGCGLPAFAWAAFLAWHYGSRDSGRAFALPLTGLLGKVRELERIWRARGFGPHLRDEVWSVVALTIQVVYLVTRPKPKLLWWRIGAAFVLLWLVLSYPVWEGNPSVATRSVLPLTMAFNVLVPRSRLGLVLLLAGNLTVLSAPTALRGVPSEQTTFTESVTLDYGPGWYRYESLGWRTWRWARGTSVTTQLHNPGSRSLAATLDFEISSLTNRTVVLRAREFEKAITLEAGKRIAARFGPFVLPPGATEITWTTAEPPGPEPGSGRRSLAFLVQNLTAVIAPTPVPN